MDDFSTISPGYAAQMLAYVQKDAWRLTFVNNANACILFLPLIYLFEGRLVAEVSNTRVGQA